MERALRLVSVERGHDPREILLLSFGGAGGLHACNLARRLGIREVIIPPLASTLSAYGMSVADVVKDYSQTIMFSGTTSPETILAKLQPLMEKGVMDIQAEGFSRNDVTLERSLDMRYSGQSYELSIPYRETFLQDFHLHHELTYGFSRQDSDVEIVNIRVRAIGDISPPPLPMLPFAGEDPTKALIEERTVHLASQPGNIPLYQGELLLHGNQISGPAIIARKDTTIFLDLQDTAFVDKYGNLVINTSQ
jgi:N-methylhydantoinase A